ncbi:MAG: hypothetical protein IKH06_04405 [Clostridiales bacterium]|nr:hypothetical protein [Clostridiales bacterium]
MEKGRLIMHKTVLLPVILIFSLLFSGCGIMSPFSTDAKGDPYDTSFKDAHAFAEYWMGPCEETGERDGNESIIHEMRDSEHGFIYTVVEMEVSSVYGSHTMYNSEDFGHYYLKAFLEKTDVVRNLEKMDKGLSVRVKELYISKDTGMVINYIPTMIIETDEKLTDDDAKEIVTEVREQLKSFDERGYFTKSEKTSSAYIDLRCAPWSSDAGKKFHGWTSRYDQDHP